MKPLALNVLHSFGTLWAAITAWRWAQPLHYALFLITTRALGYGHCCDFYQSGERWFIHRLRGEDVASIIDVGANVGNFSRLCLDLTSARIIAIEPLPVAFEQLASLASAEPDRFTAWNFAVGELEGEGTLLAATETSSTASFSPIDFPYSSTDNQRFSIATAIRTLDCLVPEIADLGIDKIDLLKVDVEGFEYEVLRGASQFIDKFEPRYIQLEFNRHHFLRGHTIELFSEMLSGYELFQLLPWKRGLARREPARVVSSLGFYSNFVFKRVEPDFPNSKIL